MKEFVSIIILIVAATAINEASVKIASLSDGLGIERHGDDVSDLLSSEKASSHCLDHSNLIFFFNKL